MGTGSSADKRNAVSVLVLLDVSANIPMLHPVGYDAKLESTDHLDSIDCQGVAVIDQFGNQDILANDMR